MKKEIKCTLAGFLAGVMIVTTISCGKIPMVKDKEDTQEASTQQMTTEGLVSLSNELSDDDFATNMTKAKISTISGIIDQVFYFDKDEENIQESIIKGYVEGLDDPYTRYYTAKEFSEFKESTEGAYVGVGVKMVQDTETMLTTITGVLDGPAKEAGVEAGDILKKVDDKDVTKMESEMIVTKVRGEEGTEVKLTVYRKSDGKTHEYTMTRRKVDTVSVYADMMDDNIGYIGITDFSENTGTQFKEEYDKLKKEGMQSLVIDLRDNGGGVVDICCEMLDYLLPEGRLCCMKNKEGRILQDFVSDENGVLGDLPCVVLVNANSASASEIFAAAMQDYGAATVVGTQTYGKGIVQRMYPFNDGSAIKVTIAKYFTPKDRDIHKIGVEPDVKIEFDKEAYIESKGKNDNQYEKAKEILFEKLGKEVKASTEAKSEEDTETKEDSGE